MISNLKKARIAAKRASGTIGDLEWNYSKGVLIISGDGEIPDYDDFHAHENSDTEYNAHSPWYPFSKDIRKIILKGNISQKGVYVFRSCENLRSIMFENTSSSLIGDISRVTQGYSLGCLWNMASWFYWQIPRMLQEYRQKSPEFDSVPGKWEAIIERMIFCFTEAGKEYDEYESLLDKDRDFAEKAMREHADYRNKMHDEGFELFSKYLYNLWW
jgi:hypothetical protein